MVVGTTEPVPDTHRSVRISLRTGAPSAPASGVLFIQPLQSGRPERDGHALRPRPALSQLPCDSESIVAGQRRKHERAVHNGHNFGTLNKTPTNRLGLPKCRSPLLRLCGFLRGYDNDECGRVRKKSRGVPTRRAIFVGL